MDNIKSLPMLENIKSEVLRIAIQSEDEELHRTIYDLLLNNGMVDDILLIKHPFVSQYLDQL